MINGKTVAVAVLLTVFGGQYLAAQTGPTQRQLNEAYSNTGDWLYATHDYSGRRFVDLDQINTANVGWLRPICLFQVGRENAAFQSNPIVYQGVMYITTQTQTIALDAKSCSVKWKHAWETEYTDPRLGNRGVAIKGGVVVRSNPDGYLMALDAQTGELLWKQKVVDPEGGYYITMPPIIYEDLVIVGSAVSEFAIRGWVGAFSFDSGEPIWKFYTIPGPGEPGSETWGDPEHAARGGGGVWTPLSLDPETGRVYVAVANPAPDFYGAVRPGDNLYTSSMIVLNARTGELQWYYQAVPHDLHDWDQTHAGPLFTTEISGRERRLVATVGKDGVLQVLDRETEERLYAVPVTTRKNVDVPLTTEGVYACPGVLGGVEWNGPAYNPGANMLYVNAVDWCTVFSVAEELRLIEGELYMGGSMEMDPEEKAQGWLTAVNASTGEVAWRYRSQRPMLASITTTSGGLVFTGELTGDFLALNARNGDVLYRFHTGGPIGGGNVTYAIEGKQYVAAISGSTSGVFDLSGSATLLIFALPD